MQMYAAVRYDFRRQSPIVQRHDAAPFHDYREQCQRPDVIVHVRETVLWRMSAVARGRLTWNFSKFSRWTSRLVLRGWSTRGSGIEDISLWRETRPQHWGNAALAIRYGRRTAVTFTTELIVHFVRSFLVGMSVSIPSAIVNCATIWPLWSFCFRL